MGKSELPKVYDPHAVEEKWYRFWEERGYFQAGPQPGGERYCITIPPPNVTGDLHMGHALQHSIHDLLIRWHRMSGKVTLCVPGTDHASISTQIKVEEKLISEGTSRQEIGRDAFLERAWQWREQYGGTILRQLRSLGCSYDWRRERFTLDEGYVRAVMTAFLRFYEKGWIYRGARMVNWCPRCQTVISDLEVEYRDLDDHLWYIRYPFPDGEGGIVVATTRPETLLGDVAVAVPPDDDRFRDLIGKQVLLPCQPRSRSGRIPVIADDQVEREFGTGALKITPYHDPNDYEITMRHEELKAWIEGTVPLEEGSPTPEAEDDEDLRDEPPDLRPRVIRKDGRMSKEAGKYAGLDRYEARDRVVEDIRAAGLLEKIEPYTHSVGHHDKCGTVIEPTISNQWFLDMQEMAQRTKEVLEKGEIRYVPERFLRYTLEWLDGIRPWCISRQLWWGQRIPVWWCQRCGHPISGRISDGEVVPPDKCDKPSCGHDKLEQDPDILDTWFSSALWPFAVLGWPDSEKEGSEQAALSEYFYPTDVLITARDILHLWVVRMVMTSLEFTDRIPFYAVFVHPTIMDPEGRRMSKSLGTGVDPMELTAKYGTDATRFGLIYQCATGQDVRFSEERMEMSRNFCNKIWNASRFVLMNLPDGELQVAEPSLTEGNLADRWICSRFAATVGEVNRSLGAYRLDEAARQLYDFFWGEFCDWYLELAKLPLSKGSEEERKRVRGILCYVLSETLKLLHPFMPFISEEIWQQLPHHGESIMVSPWLADPPAWQDSQAEMEMDLIMEIVAKTRKLRADHQVPPADRVRISIASQSQAMLDLLKSNEPAILLLTKGESLSLSAQSPAAGSRTGLSVPSLMETIRWQEAEAGVSISSTATAEGIAGERERLQRELEKTNQELERVAGKLENADFVNRAPQQVVEKARGEREELQAQLETLTARLQALSKRAG